MLVFGHHIPGVLNKLSQGNISIIWRASKNTLTTIIVRTILIIKFPYLLINCTSGFAGNGINSFILNISCISKRLILTNYCSWVADFRKADCINLKEIIHFSLSLNPSNFLVRLGIVKQFNCYQCLRIITKILVE